MCSFFVATPRYTKHPSLNNLHNQNAPQVKNDCILIGFNKRMQFLGREGEKNIFKSPCLSFGWMVLEFPFPSIVLECPCSSVYCTGMPLFIYCTRIPLSIIYCTSETDSNSKEHELHPSKASSHI